MAEKSSKTWNSGTAEERIRAYGNENKNIGEDSDTQDRVQGGRLYHAGVRNRDSVLIFTGLRRLLRAIKKENLTKEKIRKRVEGEIKDSENI